MEKLQDDSVAKMIEKFPYFPISIPINSQVLSFFINSQSPANLRMRSQIFYLFLQYMLLFSNFHKSSYIVCFFSIPSFIIVFPLDYIGIGKRLSVAKSIFPYSNSDFRLRKDRKFSAPSQLWDFPPT